MRNIVPVIMAGILGIYGLIVAAILVGKIQVRAASIQCADDERAPCAGTLAVPRHRALAPLPTIAPHSAPILQVPLPTGNKYSSFAGFSHLAAGLACGLSSLAAGLAIGVVGDAGVRAVGQQDKLYVGMILILIFGEALGLYGLIVALILSQKGALPPCRCREARASRRGARCRAARHALFFFPPSSAGGDPVC